MFQTLSLIDNNQWNVMFKLIRSIKFSIGLIWHKTLKFTRLFEIQQLIEWNHYESGEFDVSVMWQWKNYCILCGCLMPMLCYNCYFITYFILNLFSITSQLDRFHFFIKMFQAISRQLEAVDISEFGTIRIKSGNFVIMIWSKVLIVRS